MDYVKFALEIALPVNKRKIVASHANQVPIDFKVPVFIDVKMDIMNLK